MPGRIRQSQSSVPCREVARVLPVSGDFDGVASLVELCRMFAKKVHDGRCKPEISAENTTTVRPLEVVSIR
jgi:hypothetical protein